MADRLLVQEAADHILQDVIPKLVGGTLTGVCYHSVLVLKSSLCADQRDGNIYICSN